MKVYESRPNLFLMTLALASVVLLPASSSGALGKILQEPAKSSGTQEDAEKGNGATVDNGDEATSEAQAAVLTAELGELARFVRRMGRLRNSSRLDEPILDLVKPLATPISPHTARIWSDKDQVGVGIVVGENGQILTSASELKNPIECQLADGRRFPAVVSGIHEVTNLALLKIDVTGLQPLELTETPSPDRGAWLVSVSPDSTPISIGVVGVPERKIGTNEAFVGILPVDVEDGHGARITQVTANSPADAADLMVNDIVTYIDDVEIIDAATLWSTLADHEPGDRVELTIKRGDGILKIGLELADRTKVLGDFEDMNQQDRMGSTLSRRRSKFPLAFQHDSGLSAGQMGSPVLDLDGKVVGINISRSGRVSSLALPMKIVLPALEALKSGSLAPAALNHTRIEAITVELKELSVELAPLGSKLQEVESTLAVEKARQEELKRIDDDLNQRLEAVTARTDELEKSMKELQQQVADLSRRTRRLESEKLLLETGAR